MKVPGLLLIVVLSLLSQALQARLRSLVHGRPWLIVAAPVVLTAIFAAAAWNAGAASLALTFLVLAYTLSPALLVLLPRGTPGVARWADLTVLLLLLVPL